MSKPPTVPSPSFFSGSQPPIARAERLCGPPVNVVDLIGKTPLIDLSRLVGRSRVRLYAKAESFNPGGSVKDRPALAMVQAAIADGRLRADQGALNRHPSSPRVLDATSGNTGIAYAMLGSAMGFGVTLCLPKNASRERQRMLHAYGAEVILTDPLEGSDGAIRIARKMAAAEPNRYVYLDQYSNDENWRAHECTTGPEIFEQTDGEISHFVTGLGTSGTFVGVGRYLRRVKPEARLISIEPDGPLHGLEGMKHMASAIVPAIYDPQLADEKRSVSTEKAYESIRNLGRHAGLLVGVSAAGNVATALDVARELERGVVVTVLCDSASKYLSESFWDEPSK